MRRKPRDSTQGILTPFGIWRIVFVGTGLLLLTLWAFFWMKSINASDELARAVAVNALVIGQIFYLINSRFKFDSSLRIEALQGNRFLFMGVGGLLVLQLMFTYLPPFQVLFGTAAMPFWTWLVLIFAGAIFFLVVELEKMLMRKNGFADRNL